jgi:hypothetical protein
MSFMSLPLKIRICSINMNQFKFWKKRGREGGARGGAEEKEEEPKENINMKINTKFQIHPLTND